MTICTTIVCTICKYIYNNIFNYLFLFIYLFIYSLFGYVSQTYKRLHPIEKRFAKVYIGVGCPEKILHGFLATLYNIYTNKPIPPIYRQDLTTLSKKNYIFPNGNGVILQCQ